jgi:hypothetical protein
MVKPRSLCICLIAPKAAPTPMGWPIAKLLELDEESAYLCEDVATFARHVLPKTMATITTIRELYRAMGVHCEVRRIFNLSYEHALAEVCGQWMHLTKCEDALFIDADIAFDPRWIPEVFGVREELLLAGTYMQSTSPPGVFCQPGDWCINSCGIPQVDAFWRDKLPEWAPNYVGESFPRILTPGAHGPNGLHPKKLLMMQIADTGFGCVRVRREAIETMAKRYPELGYSSRYVPGQTIHALWDPFIAPLGVEKARRRTAGDTCFFMRARECGIQPWAIGNMLIDHANLGAISFEAWYFNGGRERMAEKNEEARATAREELPSETAALS